MDDQIYTQRRFIIVQDGLSYADAIVLLQDQYIKLSDKDIANIKQGRFDDYQQQLKDAQTVADNTDPKTAVTDQISDIDDEIANLNAQRDTLVKEAIILGVDPITIDPTPIDPINPVIEGK